MTKTESDYFFSSTKIRIFFSATLRIKIFFLEKNITPPLFTLNGRSLRCLGTYERRSEYSSTVLREAQEQVDTRDVSTITQLFCARFRNIRETFRVLPSCSVRGLRTYERRSEYYSTVLCEAQEQVDTRDVSSITQLFCARLRNRQIRDISSITQLFCARVRNRQIRDISSITQLFCARLMNIRETFRVLRS